MIIRFLWKFLLFKLKTRKQHKLSKCFYFWIFSVNVHVNSVSFGSLGWWGMFSIMENCHFLEGRENEIVVWTKLVGWKVGIFVTFIKLQELHQSLYKSQINSINNKGMLDLMNKTTSRAHEFRFPVVRKFHKPERNKASECIFTISCTPSWQGWKAMKANQQLFDWWWAGCDLWERRRRRIQIKIWVIPDILQTVVVWHW